MPPWVALLVAVVVFLVLWAARLRYFRGRMERARTLLNQYRGMVPEDQSQFAARREELWRRTNEVLDLWRQAGVEDSTFTQVEVLRPAPFQNFMGTQNYSAQKNWLTLNEDVVAYVHLAFNRAIGHYEDRFREAKNPVYTLMALLTAPQSLVRWLGLGTGAGTGSKLLSVVWSALLVITAFMQLFGVSLRDLGIDILAR